MRMVIGGVVFDTSPEGDLPTNATDTVTVIRPQMQRGVVELADRSREELQGVGFVSCGLRCPQHNANEGGVSDSRHLSGKAIDLRIEGKAARQTLA